MEHVSQILERFRGQPEMVLEALRELQAASETNSLGEPELIEVAEALRMPLSKVYGVATFYSMFSVRPRGRHIIRVCESAPCHLRGTESVVAWLEDELAVKMGETTADGRFTLEFTSCLGVCGVAPAVMIDAEVHGNLTRERIVEALKRYE
ncbi:MAG: NADH-quinone oxidoreductase subunit NuoE [Bacillota bacterium]